MKSFRRRRDDQAQTKIKQSHLTSAATLQRMNLVIANRQSAKKINTRRLKQIVNGLFVELKITDAELGINLVGAREMALVNETFLRHEGATDVITFDHADEVAQASRLPEGSSKQAIRRQDACATLHGELFVCVDEAISQAKHFKTSWQAEVVRYVVHGILHLLGHDDLTPELRRKMKREENRLVRLLGRRFALAQLSPTAKISA